MGAKTGGTVQWSALGRSAVAIAQDHMPHPSMHAYITTHSPQVQDVTKSQHHVPTAEATMPAGFETALL